MIVTMVRTIMIVMMRRMMTIVVMMKRKTNDKEITTGSFEISLNLGT